jgi:serine/threonine protein kinase
MYHTIHIVTEVCSGGELFDLFKKHKYNITEKQIASIIEQILYALV